MSKKSPKAVDRPATRRSLRRMVRPSYDDWQEAYEEAAGHLEYCAGISKGHETEGERRAKELLSNRLRAAAKRMRLNS